jgi:hypothetical protein
MATSSSSGYSADVQLWLETAGLIVELTQVGPDSIVVRQPITLPSSEADVVMQIDGHERRWRVLLPNGLSAESTIAETTPC